jgi:PAS domain S-box-containing protein
MKWVLRERKDEITKCSRIDGVRDPRHPQKGTDLEDGDHQRREPLAMIELVTSAPTAPGVRQLDTLHAVLQHSRGGIAVVGDDGLLVYANPALLLLLGGAASGSPGTPIVSLIHPDDQRAAEDLFADVLSRHDGSERSVFRWRCGDKSWHALHTTWINQLTVAGVAGVVIHFSEVGVLPPPTQLFDPSSSRLLQILIENAVHITAIIDRDGTLRYVSPAVERMLGYTPAFLVGKGMSTVVHPEDQPSMECLAQPRPQGGPTQLSQFRARHKDGSWRVMEAIVTNRLDDPLVGGIVVDARDITERKWSAERVQHGLEALLAINQVGRLLGTNPERQAIGAALLESARRIAPIEEATLLLRTPRGNLTRALTSGGDGLMWPTVRRTHSARAARHEVLKTGSPAFFRVRPAQPGFNPIEGWDVPLHAQERVIGILEVYGANLLPGPGIDELSILADQAASALERARLYQELAERERRLEALVRQLLLAEEEEHRRVAYEIHDGLAQLAWAAQQHLEAFAAQYHSRNQERRAELGLALTLASRTVREARRVIAGLRPAILDDFGLSSAISFELQAQRADGVEVEFNDGLGGTRLDPTLETPLFRVVQEALSNVRKHAHSKRVAVTLERRTNNLHLEVRDWGRGFRLATAQAGVGRGEQVGLAGMHERIALISGRLTIRSRPGAGTRVQVQAPFRELVAEA